MALAQSPVASEARVTAPAVQGVGDRFTSKQLARLLNVSFAEAHLAVRFLSRLDAIRVVQMAAPAGGRPAKVYQFRATRHATELHALLLGDRRRTLIERMTEDA